MMRRAERGMTSLVGMMLLGVMLLAACALAFLFISFTYREEQYLVKQRK